MSCVLSAVRWRQLQVGQTRGRAMGRVRRCVRPTQRTLQSRHKATDAHGRTNFFPARQLSGGLHPEAELQPVVVAARVKKGTQWDFHSRRLALEVQLAIANLV